MKAINNILSIGLVFGSVFAFTSCDKDEVETVKKTFVVEAASTGLTFTAANAESQFIEFTANGKWTASINAAWATISPESGDREGNIEVKVVENTTFVQRDAEITIKDIETSITQTVKIIQGGKGQSIIFNKENALLSFGEKEITDTITVTANYTWTLEEVPTWLTYEVVSTSSTSTNKVILIADIDKLTQNATEGEIVFKDKGNNFEDFKYTVNYPGFEPSMSFKQGLGVESSDVIDYTFDFEYSSDNEVKAKLYITTNYEFDFENVSEAISDIKELHNPNKLVNGFSSVRQYFVTFNGDMIDTDTQRVTFDIKSLNLDGIENITLTGVVPGVGNNFIFADYSKFQRDMEGSGALIFEAGSINPQTWEKEGYIMDTLTIASSLKVEGSENQWPYAIFVADAKDSRVSMPYIPIKDNWVYVDKIEAEPTKAPVAQTQFQIEVGVRGMGMDFSPFTKREFAVFVVERTSPEMTVEDLFDENGEVKEEYANSYQLFMQSAKMINYDFITPEMPNKKMTIGAEQATGEFTFYVEGILDPIGVSFIVDYFAEDGQVSGTPWSDNPNDPIIKDIDLKFDYETGIYKITLSFNKNLSSQDRIGYYGFSVFESEKEFPGFGFEITQVGKVD